MVLLRGDMDGLLIPEATSMEFSSKIEEGVLDAAGKRADRAYGLHVFSSILPTGTFATKPGTIMAASDTMIVDIIGQGGHGSTPSLANDPVPVMAEIITALQTLVTKKFNAFDPVVINVGIANAGQAYNVIPEKCHIECSIRSFSITHRQKLSELTQTLVHGICAAHGMRAEIEYRRGVAPTVCDPDATAFARTQIETLFGADRHVAMARPLGRFRGLLRGAGPGARLLRPLLGRPCRSRCGHQHLQSLGHCMVR